MHATSSYRVDRECLEREAKAIAKRAQNTGAKHGVKSISLLAVKP